GFLSLAFELGNITLDRGIQVHLSALNQQHDRGSAGYDLSERRGVEDRVLSHALDFRDHGAIPISLVINGPAMFQPKHSTRTLLVRYRLANRFVHLRQLLRTNCGMSCLGTNGPANSENLGKENGPAHLIDHEAA